MRLDINDIKQQRELERLRRPTRFRKWRVSLRSIASEMTRNAGRRAGEIATDFADCAPVDHRHDPPDIEAERAEMRDLVRQWRDAIEARALTTGDARTLAALDRVTRGRRRADDLRRLRAATPENMLKKLAALL